ncbi:hypothetical protein G7085_18110 [Tessaracoccus sp. HDW20]|uniref:hypothetical protein n=1 Tax=Tessaracoccus coleopterorum TaxID=2714950 RepID=UPI0018D38CCA|nr:hypothetical protein [Tessaracoccus coleopterorum]NHB85832.1 hypothetical protein [Tessaracoccus coleopterorum]
MLAAAGAEEPEATAATLLHFVLGHAVEEQTRFQLSELGVVTGFDPALAEHRFAWGCDSSCGGRARGRRHVRRRSGGLGWAP